MLANVNKFWIACIECDFHVLRIFLNANCYRSKKPSLWDQAPSGYEVGNALTAVMTPNPAALNPHLNRQARRLYVGNIPASVSDVSIRKYFLTVRSNLLSSLTLLCSLQVLQKIIILPPSLQYK